MTTFDREAWKAKEAARRATIQKATDARMANLAAARRRAHARTRWVLALLDGGPVPKSRHMKQEDGELRLYGFTAHGSGYKSQKDWGNVCIGFFGRDDDHRAAMSLKMGDYLASEGVPYTRVRFTSQGTIYVDVTNLTQADPVVDEAEEVKS